MKIQKFKYFELVDRYRKELKELQQSCVHNPDELAIEFNIAVIGEYPMFYIACPNCGKLKLMFIKNQKEYETLIERTLNRQEGIEDQRLDLHVEARWPHNSPYMKTTFESINKEISDMVKNK